jgi:hypothetical protein
MPKGGKAKDADEVMDLALLAHSLEMMCRHKQLRAQAKEAVVARMKEARLFRSSDQNPEYVR